MKKNLKDYLTDIVAIVLIALEPISSILIEERNLNWKNFLGYILMAIVAYATGKKNDLRRKNE